MDVELVVSESFESFIEGSTCEIDDTLKTYVVQSYEHQKCLFLKSSSVTELP